MSNKEPKSFFELPEEEQKKIVIRATERANEEQARLMPNKDWKTVKLVNCEVPLNTPIKLVKRGNRIGYRKIDIRQLLKKAEDKLAIAYTEGLKIKEEEADKRVKEAKREMVEKIEKIEKIIDKLEVDQCEDSFYFGMIINKKQAVDALSKLFEEGEEKAYQKERLDETQTQEMANYKQFFAAVVYHLNNPESKMDIPSIVYEAIDSKVSQFPKDRVMTEDEALKLAGRTLKDTDSDKGER